MRTRCNNITILLIYCNIYNTIRLMNILQYAIYHHIKLLPSKLIITYKNDWASCNQICSFSKFIINHIHIAIRQYIAIHSKAICNVALTHIVTPLARTCVCVRAKVFMSVCARTCVCEQKSHHQLFMILVVYMYVWCVNL